jgi:hypothetical protein
MNKSTLQYAPWSEDEEEDRPLMSDEQIRVAAKKVAAAMKKGGFGKEPDHKPSPNWPFDKSK